MRTRSKRTAALLAAAALLMPACATRRDVDVTFHDANMDFGMIQSVAVMPFVNLSAGRSAGEAVREVFMTMMQATGAAYVLPPGEVARGISRISLKTADAPASDDIVQLAKVVGADVVITGTVLEYGELRSAGSAANVVSISVKMFEGQTGRMVWSAAASKGGVSAGDRLFGGGGQPMDAVTREAVGDLLDRLFEK